MLNAENVNGLALYDIVPRSGHDLLKSVEYYYGKDFLKERMQIVPQRKIKYG